MSANARPGSSRGQRPGGGARRSKRSLAASELVTAVELFFNDCDPVAVHVLACTGGRIVREASRAAKREGMHGSLERIVKKRHRPRLESALARASTALECAIGGRRLGGRIDEALVEQVLFVSAIDYETAFGPLPPALQVFRGWMIASHPEWIDDYPGKEVIAQFFGGKENLSVRDRKSLGKATLEGLYGYSLLSRPGEGFEGA